MLISGCVLKLYMFLVKVWFLLLVHSLRIATTIRLVGQFNSVKMGIRLFNKRAKPKEVVKVEEHSS